MERLERKNEHFIFFAIFGNVFQMWQVRFMKCGKPHKKQDRCSLISAFFNFIQKNLRPQSPVGAHDYFPRIRSDKSP